MKIIPEKESCVLKVWSVAVTIIDQHQLRLSFVICLLQKYIFVRYIRHAARLSFGSIAVLTIGNSRVFELAKLISSSFN